MDYREEMKQLRDTLNAHGYRYYVLDDPQLSLIHISEPTRPY